MLKITTTTKHGSTPAIKLEGKLLQPWVDEVRRLFVDAEDCPPACLELSAVTFVDDAGAELLVELRRQGVEIVSCTPYVAELLRLKSHQIF